MYIKTDISFDDVAPWETRDKNQLKIDTAKTSSNEFIAPDFSDEQSHHEPEITPENAIDEAKTARKAACTEESKRNAERLAEIQAKLMECGKLAVERKAAAAASKSDPDVKPMQEQQSQQEVKQDAEPENRKQWINYGYQLAVANLSQVLKPEVYKRWCNESNGNDRAVLMVLATMAGNGKCSSNGYCSPSIELISERSEHKLSPNTIRTALKKLETMEIIKIEHRFNSNGKRTSSGYQLLFKPFKF